MRADRPGGAWGEPVARLRGVSLRYRAIVALDGVDLDIPGGVVAGFIGPDGVGKSSLLALLSGVRAVQAGSVHVLGGDMARARQRRALCPRIAYLPQGLGRNLYATLSVEENLQFFARLFGHDAGGRRQRIDTLARATGLHPFLHRPVGQLSGGMRQKLGLCCALIHDPDLLILDEPTTGVDPLSRAHFWMLVDGIRVRRPGMGVVVATASMEEARRFDWLAVMDAGRVLASGAPAELLARTGCDDLEAAFVALLPPRRRDHHQPLAPQPLAAGPRAVAIEARGLTVRFGDFVAVDAVSFSIGRGEIFGFIGSNGCGKTTTMKTLTGLLPASAGEVWLFGQPVDPRDEVTRSRVGYMSQSFSLYGELSVRQNLELHARLFRVPPERRAARVARMLARFGLETVQGSLPARLPLGMRQRLSLAVAMVHEPEVLILDEPTSGVDPIARDDFWRLMLELARGDQVTLFISTHFMNEAMRCDRIALMHAGRVLETGTPGDILARHGGVSLDEAFARVLASAADAPAITGPGLARALPSGPASIRGAEAASWPWRLQRSLGRLASYVWRETLELRRDPVRGALALGGSLLLLFVIGYGISMDVEGLRFAVLDRDQTATSRDYALQLSGSRDFIERPALADHAELDRRMRSGEVSLALEIPAGFERRLGRGEPVEVAAWIDGAMPQRAETVLGYAQGMHAHWLQAHLRETGAPEPPALATVETRYRYNPDVRSLPAMVPAVMPMLLLMLPAMLTALAVVREKELGSIVNFYATPTTRVEFLMGKQLPYVALGMGNFVIMCLAAVTVFGVPVTGSFATLTLGTLLFVICSTGMGLLASTVTRSQIAAMFFTMVGTMIPAVQFAGLLNPVSSLEGAGRLVGEIHPASHMFIVSRGVFSKALGLADLGREFRALALAAPVILAAAVLALRKQER